MAEQLRLGFTGDVMLGRLVDRKQRHRPPAAVWGETIETLRSLDGLFINLECCLSTRGRKYRGSYHPYHFRADPDWAVPALEAATVDWVALANNHVLDFGERALEDTIDALSAAGIQYAGAGRSVEEARAPTAVSVDRINVALLSFTDNTPPFAAGPADPGTAYVEIDVDDPETRRVVTDSVEAARASNPDLLVASLHWGPNMESEPPPAFERFGRWLIDQGVDVVHGHSAHVFQGVERYDGRPILYDTGDFVDDYAVDETLRNDRSFLFELRVTADDGTPVDLRLHPTEIEECSVNWAGEDVARWSRVRMRERAAAYDTEFERTNSGLVVDLEASNPSRQ